MLLLVTQRRNLIGYWILWGPWLALVLFHIATYAESRYLFPGRPCLILMAALALVPRLQGLIPVQPKPVAFAATSRP